MNRPINRTRSWDEGTLVPGVICHVCGSSEIVYQGTAESLINTESGAIKTTYLTYWRLCIKCKDKGWQEPKKSYIGLLIYINPKTKETKTLKSF